MSAGHRTITIDVQGVPFEVDVICQSKTNPAKNPKRWCVRIAGTKHDLDMVLDKGVLREIDRRIQGGELDEEPAFDVPTQGVPA